MSSSGAESQRGERPAQEDEDWAGREQEQHFPPEDRGESYGDPDVLLDVPALRVEEIDLEVEDLQARIAFQAELADLVKISVGLDVGLGEVKLGIKGVEAKAQLKARLDNVRAIFSEVLESVQYNPQFFRDVSGRTHQTDESAARPSPQGDEPAHRSLHGSLDAAEPVQSEDTAAGEMDDRGMADRQVEATGAARQRAQELDVDLSTLEGTGSGGRILVRDVQKAARG